jgi:phthiocerol/phenolphthiocerol synthesis type-I polyketide synthase E
LGVEHVGVYDPFLELGGHSLLAVQLIARIHDDFKTRLSLQQIFGSGSGATIAGLAELIATIRWAEGSSRPGPAEPDGEREEGVL